MAFAKGGEGPTRRQGAPEWPRRPLGERAKTIAEATRKIATMLDAPTFPGVATNTCHSLSALDGSGYQGHSGVTRRPVRS